MKGKKPSWRQLAAALSIAVLLPHPSTPGAELEEILRRGKLIVAVKDNSRPLGFYGTAGNLQGLEIDLARRLAEELLGSPEAVDFKPVSNAERLPAVTEGAVDLAIARVTATPSRSLQVDFSPYYYLDGTGLVTQNPTIQQLRDLVRGKIAVLEGSSTIAAIRSELPQAHLVGVASYQEALGLLEGGNADAFAADNSVLAGWVQEHSQYRLLPVRLSAEVLAVAMPKGLQHASLRGFINAAILRWRESGWLQERAQYWGLPFASGESSIDTIR